MSQDALQYAHNHRTDFLESLKALLRIPSVSTTPENKADMEQAAEWLVDKLTAIGLDNAKIMPTGGPPVVYADWLQAGADKPTLLIYGHYDVQPVDPVDEWHTPPFEPTIKDDNIYARGATDDKGQFYIHLAAVESYLQAVGHLPINVKFMLEGEEELGSPHLDDFVIEHQELFRADAALISDTPLVDPDTPLIITGVRGLTYMEISMRGSRQDLHSGAYGGVVENPLNAMVKLLAALRNEDGSVAIPGFYDQVKALTPADREVLNANGTSAEKIMAETGAPTLWGEADYTIAERIGARPTLDIHGIRGGFVGEGQKTVIPAQATAKVSMRLVPDQDPAEIGRLFEAYVRTLSPATMEVSVRKLSGGEAALVDLSASALEAAAVAYERVFGQRPYYRREGGTLPIVGLINKVLNAPVVMMGFGLPDDNLHAPNEKFHLPNFYRGIETAIHYYDILGQGRDG